MLFRPGENQGLPSALDAAWPRLVQGGGGPQPKDCPLWPVYAAVAEADEIVIGQFGQSLDGRVATPTGKSRYIGGPESIRHLHRLRALVDAVVVGVGTVVADDPQLSVREVPGPCPARVVIDPNFRLPACARMLGDGQSAIYAVQAEDRPRPDGITPILAPKTGDIIAPADIVTALRAAGFKRILVEGGSATLSQFLAAGTLDRLHVSVAPIILGSGPVGLSLPPIDELDEAKRPATLTYGLGADVLFDCVFATQAA
jgi:riboflavin-specific deaminase-like protein